MKKLARALGLLGMAVCAFADGPARADLPPPPGTNKVQYAFRVTGVTSGFVAVAHPTYVSKGGSASVLTPDKDEMLYQGYVPSLYALPAADAAELAGKEQDEAQKILAAKGRRCLEKVPRVFVVDSDTKIRAMVDVIRIDASATDCHASLVKTIYRGEPGEEGEGGIDASGRRTPPAPFSVGDLAPVLGMTAKGAASPSSTGTSAPDSPPPSPTSTETTPPSNTPPPEAPHAGCAGCATPVAPVTEGAALATLALGALAIRRRPLRSRRDSSGRQAR